MRISEKTKKTPTKKPFLFVESKGGLKLKCQCEDLSPNKNHESDLVLSKDIPQK